MRNVTLPFGLRKPDRNGPTAQVRSKCPCSRGGWLLPFAVFGVALALSSITALAAKFTATLDRDTVAVGESATLTLSFEGGQPKAIPTPPTQPNLQIADQGSAQNVSIAMGQMSSTISETFSLTPLQPGIYRIPALTTVVNGQTLASRPLVLKAVKPSASDAGGNGQQLAFLKLWVPQKEVYVGEVIQAQVQMLIREGIVNGEGLLQGFEQLGGSSLKAEGFTVMKTAPAQRRRVQIGNSIFGVATLVTALSPVKTGNLDISSVAPSFTVQIPASGGRRDPFDPFGMFQQYRQQHVSLAAESATLKVLPLPQANVPDSFNGAVGNYSLKVTAGPTNVAAGDPITVHVEITGSGALDSLSFPKQKDWPGFKIYPPTSKVETTDALGVQGTKTFEEVVVPQKQDIADLPEITFSFFDPDSKGYRTLNGPAIPVTVQPAAPPRRLPPLLQRVIIPTIRHRHPPISFRSSSTWALSENSECP